VSVRGWSRGARCLGNLQTGTSERCGDLDRRRAEAKTSGLLLQHAPVDGQTMLNVRDLLQPVIHPGKQDIGADSRIE
jgi:hypothetical protein